jgi:phage gp37-like protein
MKKREALQSPSAKDERLALIRRVDTENPSKADVEAVAALMREKPDVWVATCDMIKQAQRHYIGSVNGTALMKESLKLKCERLTAELSEPNDGELEKTLVDHAVLCWLRLSVVEQQYTNALSQSITLTLGMYWEKRLTAVQKRFQKACESLARVRKLHRSPKAKLTVNVLNATLNDGAGHEGAERVLAPSLPCPKT